MVVPLGPGKFYGSSLPRPRFYTDFKLNNTRVDPPLPVLDPLLSWAEEAHCSMGGLSTKRLRMQGKIEGNIQKLKKQNESSTLKRKGIEDVGCADSPPPAPISKKSVARARVVVDEGVKKRRLVRKLGDDFEMVVNEGLDESVALRTRSRFTPRRCMVLGEEDEVGSDGEGVLGSVLLKEGSGKCVNGSGFGSVNGTRSSPRLKNKK